MATILASLRYQFFDQTILCRLSERSRGAKFASICTQRLHPARREKFRRLSELRSCHIFHQEREFSIPF
jgi:hypothetical protein